MDMNRLRAFVGLSAKNDPRFKKLAPLVEEYAEDIEAAIDEAELEDGEPVTSSKLTLLRTAMGEIDPDLAEALEEELSHGITEDQAQTLAAQLNVSCAMADQDRVARVFVELSKAYVTDELLDSGETDLTESDEIELPDDLESDDEIEAG